MTGSSALDEEPLSKRPKLSNSIPISSSPYEQGTPEEGLVALGVDIDEPSPCPKESTNTISHVHVPPPEIVTIDFQTAMGVENDEDEIIPTPPNPNKTEPDTSTTDESSTSELDEPLGGEQGPKQKKNPKEKKRKKSKSQLHRKNIKDLLSHDQLGEKTLALQREELERRERIAAKQQQLLLHQQLTAKTNNNGSSFTNFPISLDDFVGKISGTSCTIEPSPAPKSKSNILEVLTISSDEDDDFGQFSASASGSSNSFYSGGTVTVNNGTGISGPVDITKHYQEVENDDDDDDDDCVILSPQPPEQETTTEEDDSANVPDELGRVLINIGHLPEEQDIFLPPKISSCIKPHQIAGIRFLYENVVESIDQFNKSAGLGCILAHSMGLGKTIQAAAFCDIFLRYTPASTVLVIVPINTIQNWLNEFNYWLPGTKNYNPKPTPAASSKDQAPKKRGRKKQQHLLEPLSNDTEISSSTISPEVSSSGQEEEPEEGDSSESKADSEVVKEDPTSRNYGVFVLNETVKTLAARAAVIREWHKQRGVLLIGYEMYRMLALRKVKKSGRKPKSQESSSFLNRDLEQENLLNQIYVNLVRPGPSLVICDEGHRIKNGGASISQALKAIKTKRRIVLTGYPLQNNLMEYYYMIDWIRPSFLGTKAEFSNMFERPIQNGQCVDSTPSDKRLMQFRSHVLHSLLEGFVQRRSHLVLQQTLPPKQEWVFLIKLTPVQTKLYQEFISYIRLQADMGNSGPNPIKAFAICCKIWNHPDIIWNALLAKKEQGGRATTSAAELIDDLEDLIEEEGISTKAKQKSIVKNATTNGNGEYSLSRPLDNRNGEDNDYCIPIFAAEAGDVFQQTRERDSSSSKDGMLSLEWANPALENYLPSLIDNGTKMELLFIIIEETLQAQDKLLVFSQSLFTLNLIELFLAMKYNWAKGTNYFRLDGSTSGLERERLIKEFNKADGTVPLFLVSTRAGSLGINLVGANRVVVFDCSWNPCHDVQAVCRVYRYGQVKPCQIYRFVTDCTLEKKIYDRQITKSSMANRVVDEQNAESVISSKDLSNSLLTDLDDLLRLQENQFEHDPEEYDDHVLQQVIIRGGHHITKAPFQHESLLIDRKEKKLSAAERRLALRNYEMEKRANTLQSYGSGTQSSGRQSSYSSTFGTSSGYISHYQTPSTSFQGNWNNYLPPQSYPRYPPLGSSSPGTGNPYLDSLRSIAPSPTTGENHHFSNHNNNNLPLPIEELRKKGVSVQGIVLKKDSFLADPSGGPDIFLMSGQRVYLFRSQKGTYLRISNGKFIAIRKRGKGAAQTILDNIPPNQDLTKEQVYVVINSILRPSIDPNMPSMTSSINSPYYSSSQQSHYTNGTRSSYGQPPPLVPPISVPLPPSLPLYGGNNPTSNLQITNHRSRDGGGDVTIWRKDPPDSSVNSSSNDKSKSTTNDLVPEIEVIKINSKGEGRRIEPQKLSYELNKCNRMYGGPLQTRNKLLNSSAYINSVYSGGPPGYMDPYIIQQPTLMPSDMELDSEPSSLPSSSAQYYNRFHRLPTSPNVPSPNSQSQDSDDIVIEYVKPSSSSSSSRYSNPSMNFQMGQQYISPLPHQSNSSGLLFENGLHVTNSNSNSHNSNLSHSILCSPSPGQYYPTTTTTSSTTSGNDKPIFTPIEQQILDDYTKSLV